MQFCSCDEKTLYLVLDEFILIIKKFGTVLHPCLSKFVFHRILYINGPRQPPDVVQSLLIAILALNRSIYGTVVQAGYGKLVLCSETLVIDRVQHALIQGSDDSSIYYLCIYYLYSSIYYFTATIVAVPIKSQHLNYCDMNCVNCHTTCNMVVADEDVEHTGYKVAKFLGYDCLKPDQRLALTEILKPHDVFAILITG